MFELLLTDYTLRTVCLGAAGVGAVSGALGCFAYLRRQSLIGDVVAHSSLVGIVGAFLLCYWLTGQGNKSLGVLIPGALSAGTASLLLTRSVTAQTRIKEDAALGVMLAIFFGSGVLLLRWTQRASPTIPGRAGLDDYLFGMAAALSQSDLWMIGLLGISSIGVMLAAWKEFKVFAFDPQFAHSLGIRTHRIDTLLLLVLVVGIVIGIQSVGVVLMIALLVTPASTARQWTRHLGPMVGLAAVIGAFCGAAGSLLSSTYARVPTGPVIVLIATALFVISLAIAPRRGLLAQWLRRRTLRHQSVATRRGDRDDY